MRDVLRSDAWRIGQAGVWDHLEVSVSILGLALGVNAGANRLRVEVDYRAERGRGGPRIVEPYSIRRTREGNLVPFVVNDCGQPRSYRVDRIAASDRRQKPSRQASGSSSEPAPVLTMESVP